MRFWRITRSLYLWNDAVNIFYQVVEVSESEACAQMSSQPDETADPEPSAVTVEAELVRNILIEYMAHVQEVRATLTNLQQQVRAIEELLELLRTSPVAQAGPLRAIALPVQASAGYVASARGRKRARSQADANEEENIPDTLVYSR